MFAMRGWGFFVMTRGTGSSVMTRDMVKTLMLCPYAQKTACLVNQHEVA